MPPNRPKDGVPHIDIDVSVRSDAWREALSDPQGFCEAVIFGIAPELELTHNHYLSLALLDDDAQQTLNAKYRGKNTPTNVLSFPSTGPGPSLGDISLAYGVCRDEAKAQDKSFRAHVSHLIVHGFLHLLGYDHLDDESAVVMEALEITLLARLNIDNPYEIHTVEL